ncbi:hypothetical protein FF38_06056 [Lucilia cuprina]|uniref:K Homology domain-containing protein n=1 Tax=Lucilia cuprina TaxID=7375 RepID=A0A0L0CLR6_LUCCU|nr:hypothetical protein FF38_06056 [Lucilia cuprina]
MVRDKGEVRRSSPYPSTYNECDFEIENRQQINFILNTNQVTCKLIQISLNKRSHVDIKFPSPEEAKNNPDAVTIIGKEDDVENAKEAILNMAEDYSRDYLENLPPSPQPQTVGAFLSAGTGSGNTNENGFVMKDAPWEKTDKKQGKSAPNTQSQEDFPAVGGAPVAAAPITSVWGPKN